MGRELSANEELAVKSIFQGIDVNSLYVQKNPNDIHGETIRGFKKEKPDNSDAVISHFISCTLLWLAREDAKRGKHLKEDFSEDEMQYPDNVYVAKSHLVTDHLTHLRRDTTKLRHFRSHSDELCLSLFREAVADLNIFDAPVTNPLVKEMGAESIKQPKLVEEVIVIPILRSGLAMLNPVMSTLTKSKIGFAGLERDDDTAIASEYYCKLPEITENSVIIITDPMLATGGTAAQLIRKINSGPIQPKEIRMVCVVAAPEGINALNKEFGNIKIFTAAVDSHLNGSFYIVPGLGDYGDRYFGTE